MGYEVDDDYIWEIENGLIDDPNGGEDEVEEDELGLFGIDRDEFDMMDDDEKREALEEAGLDPDDFDDLF